MTSDKASISGEDYSFSRPFDAHRWADYPELNACLTDLIEELETLEMRKRHRNEIEQKKFREAVRCLVLDMYVAWETNPELCIGISLANSDYTTESRYRALFLRWSSFKKAYDLLVDSGYILLVARGFIDRSSGIGRTTRIKASPKLIQFLTEKALLNITRISSRVSGCETIILRGEKPKGNSNKTAPDLEYGDTSATLEMRANLAKINRHLQKQCIDVCLSDGDFKALNERMRKDYDAGEREAPFIDFTQKALVRIFNNNDWEQGGRFYRGWWQAIPKECRKHITINGKSVCEVDYSALHPTLLYAEIGQPFEHDDAYDIGVPNASRSLIKTTYNKMLNAKGRIKEPKDFSALKVGLSWEKFQAVISEKHSQIAHFFNTGYGLKLQRFDSNLAESVMLRFIDKGYACLPVHDSFLVHHALVDELKEAMIEEFKMQTGRTIAVKAITMIDNGMVHPPVIAPIEISDDLFGQSGEFSGYNQRLLDWNINR